MHLSNGQQGATPLIGREVQLYRSESGFMTSLNAFLRVHGVSDSSLACFVRWSRDEWQGHLMIDKFLPYEGTTSLISDPPLARHIASKDGDLLSFTADFTKRYMMSQWLHPSFIYSFCVMLIKSFAKLHVNCNTCLYSGGIFVSQKKRKNYFKLYFVLVNDVAVI